VDDLKADIGLLPSETRDDAALQVVLDAAVATVERELEGDWNFGSTSLLPSPPDRVVVGTVRLAARWHALRRSPEGVIDAGDLGTLRVPHIGADIERMLGVGKYRRPMVL
jgi:hypothetical protein